MNEIVKASASDPPQLLAKARSILARAETLQDVLKVRMLAKMAAQLTAQYAKTVEVSYAIAQEASDIRLRAERRAGEMLEESKKRGDRTTGYAPLKKVESHAVTPLAQLADLRITRMQSSRWQQIAKVPEPVFEKYIEEVRKSKTKELTTAGLITQVKVETKAAEKKRIVEQIKAEAPKYPEGPFRVLAVDPPWKYGKRAEDSTHRAANPYPDMTLDEIRDKTPAVKLAHADCILWLWTTNAFLREAFTLLDAWKFEQKTILTWVKDRMGLGDWLRGQTEHCLLAARGRPVLNLTNQPTALIAPMREHSRKPEEFYLLVEALCPGNKCELFARSRRDGWASWGPEKDRF